MRLGLSSAAAPDATLDELLSACVRRGLSSLELRAEDAHGAGDSVSPADIRSRTAQAGVVLAGLRSPGGPDETRLARVACAAGTFLVLDGDSVAARIGRARRLAATGAQLAIAIDSAAGLKQVLERGFDFVWDVDPGSADAETLLERASGRLLQGWGEAAQVLPDL